VLDGLRQAYRYPPPPFGETRRSAITGRAGRRPPEQRGLGRILPLGSRPCPPPVPRRGADPWVALAGEIACQPTNLLAQEARAKNKPKHAESGRRRRRPGVAAHQYRSSPKSRAPPAAPEGLAGRSPQRQIRQQFVFFPARRPPTAPASAGRSDLQSAIGLNPPKSGTSLAVNCEARHWTGIATIQTAIPSRR